MGCNEVKHLGTLGDLGQPRGALQQAVGWPHFHHDVFVSCIAKNNS
jgi:hypothetical protein